MPSRYSVVQYAPDPFSGERVNIGVFVFGEGKFLSEFLDSWERVECFAAGADTRFLRDFAATVQDADPEQLGLVPQEGFASLTEADFRKIAASWANAIQFTPPRASLDNPEQLLADITPLFLRQGSARRRPAFTPRSRRTAARIAAEGLDNAVRRAGFDVDVRRRAWLNGRVERYEFDALAENGTPFIVTHGLSFELADEGEVIRNVDALGLAVRDVRDAFPDLDIGIVGLRRPSDEERAPFLRALHLFGAFGARVLAEPDINAWAEDIVRTYANEHGILPREQPMLG